MASFIDDKGEEIFDGEFDEPEFEGPADEATGGISSAIEKLLGKNSDASIITNITTWQGKPISPRGHFFDVLQSWESFVSLNSMWMVFFKIPDIVSDEVMKDWGEHILNVGDSKTSGSINTAKKMLIKPKHQQLIGCAFAQTVTTPAEQTAIEVVGTNNRGFLKGPIVTQRAPFTPLQIEFLETTVSFVDFVLRPWVVLNSHYGLIARDDAQFKLTTDVIVINFARTGTEFEFDQTGSDPLSIKNKRGFIPRKMWVFSGCQPTLVSSERYSYEATTAVERRDTEWYYKRYQVLLPTFLEESFNKIEQQEQKNSNDFWAASKDGVGMTYHQNDQARVEETLDSSKLFWGEGKDPSNTTHPILNRNNKQQPSTFYPNESQGRPDLSLSPDIIVKTSSIMSRILWKNTRPDLNLPGEIYTPGDEAYDIQLAAQSGVTGTTPLIRNLQNLPTNKPTSIQSGEYNLFGMGVTDSLLGTQAGISNNSSTIANQNTKPSSTQSGEYGVYENDRYNQELSLQPDDLYNSSQGRDQNSKPTSLQSGEYNVFGSSQYAKPDSYGKLGILSKQMRSEQIIPAKSNISGRPRYDIFGLLGF